MLPILFYRLSVSPRGIFQLIRKNIFKERLFRLKLVQDEKTNKWISDADWTPLKGLEADTPWELLVAIAILIAPEGEIELTPKRKSQLLLDKSEPEQPPKNS